MRYKRVLVKTLDDGSKRFVIVMDDGVEFEFVNGPEFTAAEAAQLVADLQAALQ